MAGSRPCESECGCAKHRPRSTSARAAITGELNPRWRGEDAAAVTVHQWLDRYHPRTGRCEECGTEERPTEYAYQRHPRPHTRNRDDYRELCRRCHARQDALDRQWRALGMKPPDRRRRRSAA